MGDLIGLLRALAGDCENTDGWEDGATTCTEAADELTAVREALTTAREALGDIAYVHETAGAMREVARAALSAAIGEDIGGGRG